MKLRIIKKGKGNKKTLKFVKAVPIMHNGMPYVAPWRSKKADKPVVVEKVKKARKTIKGRRVDDVVTSYCAWPPPGAKVTGAYDYIMPKPGDEPVVIKNRPLIVPPKKDKNGKIVAKKYTHLRDGIKVTVGKGWPDCSMRANARVTLNGDLVTNIYAKDWDRCYTVLRENYGIDLRPF